MEHYQILDISLEDTSMVLGLGKDKKQDTPKAKAMEATFTNPLEMIFSGGNHQQRQITDSEKFLETWLSRKHLPMKTCLTQDQVNGITILASLAAQFKIKPLKNLLMNFIMYMISKDAQSANQLVSIFQAKGLIDEKEMDMISKFAR
jgi:hypothetical protein